MPLGRAAAAALLSVVTIAQSGCGSATTAPPPTAAPASPPAPPSPHLPSDMALGQLFAVSFGGREVTPALRRLIVEDKVGTVLIFPSNFGDVDDLARLVADLRALGRQAGLPAPLLVTTDQEGGSARTVNDGIAYLAAPRSLGEEGPPAVRAATAATARGLHRLGIRLDLAPVADLRTNPRDEAIGDRSFGSDPEVVGPLVAAAVQGLHDGGVAATIKHFPGLGGAAGDPHHHLPTDPVSAARWRATQRASFLQAIAAGADAVMTTAVSVPNLDSSGTPALFSRQVVQGLLREGLDFNGVIVTDSLSLSGIGESYPLPEAAVAAARAGNDLLLLSNSDPGYEAQAIEAVRVAVRSGSIPAAQVQRSAARVISLAERWGH
ncbi:MAG: glycoside hydrolase family 3 N-terminal domain-containing protein [Candidatus Dormibacteria bacterium]